MKTKTVIYLLTILLIFSFGPHLSFGKDQIVIGGIDGLNPDINQSQHNILLALSGGGARGLTIVGVLRALEEKDINIAGIAGTSIGGIIGGLYASGYSPDELDSIISNINFNQLFSNSPPRRSMFFTKREDANKHIISIRFDGFRPVIPKGLTAGQQLTSLLTKLTAKADYTCGGDFRKLPIPFLTISTDIVTGQQIILDTGLIADAMRATMAFPLAFTGVDRHNMILMDGGILTPIPVDLARTLSDSITFVVAVNTAGQLLKKEELLTPLDIADQVTSIMTAERLREQLEKADFVITPPIDLSTSKDFHNKNKLIEIGYQAGLKAADSIKKVLTPNDYSKRYYISSIEFIDFPQACTPALRSKLLYQTFSKHQLIKALKETYQKGNLFELSLSGLPETSNRTPLDSVKISINGYQNLISDEYQFEFEGNLTIDNSLLSSQFETTGIYLTALELKAYLNRILDFYHSKGYDLVLIKDVTIDRMNKIIKIIIDEAVITRVDIENNQHTKDWYVRSYFPLKKDMPFSMTKATEGLRNLYGTSLFHRISVQPQPSDDGVVVNIRVEEKNNVQMRLGWHWDDEFESEEFVELLNDNVAQIGLEYLIHARYSPDNRDYHLSFKADRIFSTYLTSKIKLFRTRLARQIYFNDEETSEIRIEKSTGLSFQLGQQLARQGTISAALIIEEKEFIEASQTQLFGLHRLRLRTTIETFNRIPFTTSGSSHHFQLELAGKMFGGDVEFTRFYTSHELYWQINPTINYHPKLSIGLSRSGLPPTEKFYMGGIHSFIGFRTHQLSGDKMFLISNELRFELPFSIYLSGRFDFGDVYIHTDQIKPSELQSGFGLTIARNTPIGPIEFGYGAVSGDQERYYVNVGFTF